MSAKAAIGLAGIVLALWLAAWVVAIWHIESGAWS